MVHIATRINNPRYIEKRSEKTEDMPTGALLDPTNYFYKNLAKVINPQSDDTHGNSQALAMTGSLHRWADAYLTANLEAPLTGIVPCATPSGVITIGPGNCRPGLRTGDLG